MANIYEGMNVRQKLAKARLYFLNQKVQKSGKNMHLEFKYFELEDIVPPAIRIFARVGLTTNIEFTDDKAVMSVFNTDNIEEAPMTFTVPGIITDFRFMQSANAYCPISVKPSERVILLKRSHP